MRVPSGVNGRLSSADPGAGPFALAAGVPALETAPALSGSVLGPSTVPSARTSVTVTRADCSSVAPGGSRCFPQPRPSNARSRTGLRVIVHSLTGVRAGLPRFRGDTHAGRRHAAARANSEQLVEAHQRSGSPRAPTSGGRHCRVGAFTRRPYRADSTLRFGKVGAGRGQA